MDTKSTLLLAVLFVVLAAGAQPVWARNGGRDSSTTVIVVPGAGDYRYGGRRGQEWDEPRMPADSYRYRHRRYWYDDYYRGDYWGRHGRYRDRYRR